MAPVARFIAAPIEPSERAAVICIFIPHDIVTPNALDNNVQEPSAVWNDNPPGWEIFAIGLGYLLPAAPANAPGQRLTGIHALRYTFEGAALPAGAAPTKMTEMTTDAPINHHRGAQVWRW